MRGVWIADEILSPVFDISSRSKSMLIKTGYPNLLHDCDFLCSNLMNYNKDQIPPLNSNHAVKKNAKTTVFSPFALFHFINDKEVLIKLQPKSPF